VLSLSALLALLALVLDGAIMLAERRHAQATADAAALAGAADLFKYYLTNKGADSGGTAKASAMLVAKNNGYTSSNSTVTVNIPPLAGDHVGKAGYVEVIVTFNQARFFSSIWGTGNLPISARAVARGQLVANSDNSTNSIGFLVLDTTSVSITENGNVGLNLPSTATFAAESTNSAFSTAGTKAEITAGKFVLAAQNNPQQLGTPPKLNGPTPIYGTATADPLSGLAAPSTSGLLTQTYSGGSGTINPGIYTGVLAIGNSNVVMNPGIYYIQPDGSGNAGITLNGNGSLDGTSGVFIYVAPGTGAMTFTNGGNGPISLNPINTGTYKGISIYVDRGWATTANNLLELGGTPGASIYGTIYAPSSNLLLHGTPQANTGSQVIIYTVTLKGNAAAGVGNGPLDGQSIGFQLVE
jgi:hypothetical protein